MKDKTRFLSSVIVSLLAGFIYYQFGSEIQNQLKGSFKAALSYNEPEEIYPQNCQSFNSLISKSDTKTKKKKNKFLIKKNIDNTNELKSVSPSISNIDIIAETQAKVSKSIPDYSMDFASILSKLNQKEIEDGKIKIDLKTNSQSDNYKIAADNFYMAPNVIKKTFSKTGIGNGFEYNYTVPAPEDINEDLEEQDVQQPVKSIEKIKCECKVKEYKYRERKTESNCTKKIRSESNSEIKIFNNSIKIIIPDVKVKIEEENNDEEINDCDEEDTM